MARLFHCFIFFSFACLFFLTPLFVIPITSELFEFNKITLIYFFTTIIVALWIGKMTIRQKVIFKKTPLDIPLILFLAANLISFAFSIDKNISLFGYYSRFNGGFLSLLTYSLLYWAFVSNLSGEETFKIITRCLLPSALIVSLYAILQHFGIDKNIWVQDVQNRVFSTLGQPNWLAAFLTAIMPLTWIFILKGETEKMKTGKLLFFYFAALFLFTAFLFTKSRSGLLGFGAAYLIFWLVTFRIYRQKIIKPFLILSSLTLVISLSVGFPFSFLSHLKILKTNPAATTSVLPPDKPEEVSSTTTASAQAGGTESGEIRKLVWKGAINIWKDYPLTGSGPETFALLFPKYKPPEHNLTSEWDFVYNKAHNEYLNYLATTGILGTLFYLIVILSSLLQIFKSESSISKQTPNSKNHLNQPEQLTIQLINIALLAGYISILVTNFFGFSVTTVNLLFFLYPAFAFSFKNYRRKDQFKLENNKKVFSSSIKALLVINGVFTVMIIISIYRYWYADFLYSQGKKFNQAKDYSAAQSILLKAIKTDPYQPVYLDELSRSTLGLAIKTFNQKQNKELTERLFQESLSEIKEAIRLSPQNPFFVKTLSANLIQMAIIDEDYLQETEEALKKLVQMTPVDPKVYYNLGLFYLREQKIKEATQTLEKGVELKPNHRDLHLALSVAYLKDGRKEEAKKEIEYILKKINPNDEVAKQRLSELE